MACNRQPGSALMFVLLRGQSTALCPIPTPCALGSLSDLGEGGQGCVGARLPPATQVRIFLGCPLPPQETRVPAVSRPC